MDGRWWVWPGKRIRPRRLVRGSKLDRENGGAKQHEELDLGAIGSGAFSKNRQLQLHPIGDRLYSGPVFENNRLVLFKQPILG